VKVLVTGSEGFFGSWLVPGLERYGHEIVRWDAKRGEDMLDVDALSAALEGCDAVVHLAAYPHFKDEIRPADFERRNIIGTARVVQAMQRAGVKRLAYTSSGALYGFGPHQPLEGWVTPPIREDTMPTLAQWALIDTYGGSKLACEEWLATLRDIVVTALRINCIEPHHKGAQIDGYHWGWWVSQGLAIRAFAAAIERDCGGFARVNVAEPCAHVDRTALEHLLTWEPAQ
jgi:nucleoside-diphosphate-sugar epimerase